MNFQRILELCAILEDCKFLRAGNFASWARMNAIRQIQELYAASVGVRFVVNWPTGISAQDGGYVESSR